MVDYDKLHQYYKCLDVDDVNIMKSLNTPTLSTNKAGNYLEVTNGKGVKLFWVDDKGANVKTVDRAVELEDVVGFPKVAEGLLYYKNQNLDFVKNIELDSLTSLHGNIHNIKSNDIESSTIKATTVEGQSVLAKVVKSDDINCDDANVTNLKAVSLQSQNVKTEHLKAKTLDVETYNPEHIETSKVQCTSILGEEANVSSIQAKEAGIIHIESQNILTQRIDIAENANIKVLNNEEAIVDDLKAVNANIKNLKYDNLIKSVSVFGSLNNPLKLNAVEQTKLDVNNEQGNIKIYNIIRDKAPQNKFILENLPDADYHVSVKSHNHLLNTNYNICQVNGVTYLFSKFNELPVNNMIVEILLERI
jgi:hypothetical protein